MATMSLLFSFFSSITLPISITLAGTVFVQVSVSVAISFVSVLFAITIVATETFVALFPMIIFC